MFPIFSKVIIVVRRSYKSEAVRLAQRVQQQVRERRGSSLPRDPSASTQPLTAGHVAGARPSISNGSSSHRLEAQIDAGESSRTRNYLSPAPAAANARVPVASANAHRPSSSSIHLEVPGMASWNGAASAGGTTVEARRQSGAVANFTSSDARRSMSARGGGAEASEACEHEERGDDGGAAERVLLLRVHDAARISVVEFVQMPRPPGPRGHAGRRGGARTGAGGCIWRVPRCARSSWTSPCRTTPSSSTSTCSRAPPFAASPSAISPRSVRRSSRLNANMLREDRRRTMENFVSSR